MVSGKSPMSRPTPSYGSGRLNLSGKTKGKIPKGPKRNFEFYFQSFESGSTRNSRKDRNGKFSDTLILFLDRGRLIHTDLFRWIVESKNNRDFTTRIICGHHVVH